MFKVFRVDFYYRYFTSLELHIALCFVLGLKVRSVNWMENVLVIFTQDIIFFFF